MTPRLAVHGVRRRLRVDPKTSGLLADVRPGNNGSSHCKNSLGVEARMVMGLPHREAQLLSGVAQVIGTRAKEQMRRVHTAPIVAAVTNKQPYGDRPKDQLPRDTMRPKPSPGTVAGAPTAHGPVPVVETSRPYVAGICSAGTVNLLLETDCQASGFRTFSHSPLYSMALVGVQDHEPHQESSPAQLENLLAERYPAFAALKG